MGGDARIVYWSNYPANDLEQDNNVLNLGGFEPPEWQVFQQSEALFANPMRQCYANLPFYHSFSQYLLSPHAYDRTGAFLQGLAEILGDSLADTFFIFSEFSACNIVDSEPNHLYRSLITTRNPMILIAAVTRAVARLEGTAPATPWGGRFLRAALPVLKAAGRFVQIGTKVLHGVPIQRHDLTDDFFPTVSSHVENIYEICKIVAARAALTPHPLRPLREALATADILSADLYSRHAGSRRPQFSPSDKIRYLDLMSHLIKLEQANLLTALNDTTLDARDRLLIYAQRQSTNRFTYQRTYVGGSPAAGAYREPGMRR